MSGRAAWREQRAGQPDFESRWGSGIAKCGNPRRTARVEHQKERTTIPPIAWGG